jgi:hypothetical protein
MAESNFYGTVTPFEEGKGMASRVSRDGMRMWLHNRVADVAVESWPSRHNGESDPKKDNWVSIRVREHDGGNTYELYSGRSTDLLRDPYGEMFRHAIKHASPETRAKLFEQLSKEVLLAHTEAP